MMPEVGLRVTRPSCGGPWRPYLRRSAPKDDLTKLSNFSPAPALPDRDPSHMMLIARAITRIAVTSEITDWAIMAIFGQVRTGRVSVGLNAVAFVNER